MDKFYNKYRILSMQIQITTLSRMCDFITTINNYNLKVEDSSENNIINKFKNQMIIQKFRIIIRFLSLFSLNKIK